VAELSKSIVTGLGRKRKNSKNSFSSGESFFQKRSILGKSIGNI